METKAVMNMEEKIKMEREMKMQRKMETEMEMEVKAKVKMLDLLGWIPVPCKPLGC